MKCRGRIKLFLIGQARGGRNIQIKSPPKNVYFYKRFKHKSHRTKSHVKSLARMQVVCQFFIPRAPCRKFCSKTVRQNNFDFKGRGVGQVVSVLAFYSNHPRLYPSKVYSLYSVNCLKGTKLYKKRPGINLLFLPFDDLIVN